MDPAVESFHSVLLLNAHATRAHWAETISTLDSVLKRRADHGRVVFCLEMVAVLMRNCAEANEFIAEFMASPEAAALDPALMETGLGPKHLALYPDFTPAPLLEALRKKYETELPGPDTVTCHPAEKSVLEKDSGEPAPMQPLLDFIYELREGGLDAWIVLEQASFETVALTHSVFLLHELSNRYLLDGNFKFALTFKTLAHENVIKASLERDRWYAAMMKEIARGTSPSELIAVRGFAHEESLGRELTRLGGTYEVVYPPSLKNVRSSIGASFGCDPQAVWKKEAKGKVLKELFVATLMLERCSGKSSEILMAKVLPLHDLLSGEDDTLFIGWGDNCLQETSKEGIVAATRALCEQLPPRTRVILMELLSSDGVE